MNATTLLRAIGQIDEEYVLEFAFVAKTKKTWRTIAAIAACAILLVSATFAVYCLRSPQPPKAVIWAEATGDIEIKQFGIIKGHLQFSENLSKAIANPKNKDAVFAIQVTELTGATKAEVFRQFIQPLNLSEIYTDALIIFASREQIAAMQCPDDMSIVLTLAHRNKQEVLL